MDKIFRLLENHKLQSYYEKFLKLGVKDEQDFIGGVTGEDLDNMGFSQVEKNHFAKMQDLIQRLRAPKPQMHVMPVLKSLKAFQLQYTYPHCPEPKFIRDMDPTHNTVEDLMLRICYQEGFGSSKGVCLFTMDGMPLTDDPFFNTWSLNDRYIENGSKLYAIFTPKENLEQAPNMSQQNRVIGATGEDKVRCHVMLKGNFDLNMNIRSDTIKDLRIRLANETGIPAHVLKYRGENDGIGNTLEACGITPDSTVHFSLSSFSEEGHNTMSLFQSDIVPSVQQTQKGLSIFFSALFVVREKHSGEGFRKVIGYIRKLSGCNPLAQSLHQLLCRNEIISKNQKIAIVEGLYTLFRELLPSLSKRRGEKIIEDPEVFENAAACWAHLITDAEKASSEHENYAAIILTSQPGQRFCEPVRIPGIPEVFEKADVLQKIKDGEKLPCCTEANLQETSIKRATDIEKVLISLPPFMTTFPAWISYNAAKSQNFQINPDQLKTFGMMNEALKAYPHLIVMPPLQLKAIGQDGPLLVYLEEDNLGVYTGKIKCYPQMVCIWNCLSGKSHSVDVNILAKKMRDIRSDQTFITTRTPKEAILVLVDSSSSMSGECYDSDDTMTRLDAVKQLFDSFANRTMAYDFHHVIGLMKFNSTVKTLHTFTETLEIFKEHIHSLNATGGTLLYDALDRGRCELNKVKQQFPDCRLRILCLTDGMDVGSLISPVDVTTKLIHSNVIVDAVLVGSKQNTTLHGISNATGGCCFKPATRKAGLKLFEMETVLSLEMRTGKEKLDPSSFKELEDLRRIFDTHGYDDMPEFSFPNELTKKATETVNALKKKIMESKSKLLVEKDLRILEELKSLHCDPHPFCTVMPSESDFTFWRILMQGPPDTPYEDGVFELYCNFGDGYPVKSPCVRFVTPVYHCNINNVGRICHNILDRNYSANITMREILDALYGLLIIPEPEDPLDSILAEEFMLNREKYDQEARRITEENASNSLEEMEKKLTGGELKGSFIPPHLICPLTKKMFVDPVRTSDGIVYERKAIEKHLKRQSTDPLQALGLSQTDLTSHQDMKKMVKEQRKRQIQETRV